MNHRQVLYFLQSEKWLSNKAEELSGGFSWRGGVNPNTEGIWVWSEPFIIQNSKREEVGLWGDMLDNACAAHRAQQGWSKKAPYFVFTPKLVFQKLLLYFTGGVDSRSRKLL